MREQALNLKVKLVVDASVKDSRYPTKADKFTVNLLTGGKSLSSVPVKNGLLPDWQTPTAAIAEKSPLTLMQPIARSFSDDNDTLYVDYHLLGNTFASLADGQIEISHDGTHVENPGFDKELAPTNTAFSLRGLIREAIKQNYLSLNCSSDVTITIRVKNRCENCNTYMSVDVSILDWTIHSYAVDF